MNILHLDSSILGDASVSRQLGRQVVAQLAGGRTDVKVVHRDLGSAPVAHLDGTILATRGTAADLLNDLQAREAALDAELLAELNAADVLVIGAPLYNFTVPTGLKAWVDRILVAGKTFRYTDKGPEGLVKGKKAVIVATAGGAHAGSPVEAMHTGYLRQVLAFIGVTDVEVVRAEGLAMGAQAREQAIAAAQDRIRGLAGAETAVA
jgi:FMN-dependent NADH-azoreductase